MLRRIDSIMLVRCLVAISCLAGVFPTPAKTNDETTPATQSGKVVELDNGATPSHGLTCIPVSENPAANVVNDEEAPVAEPVAEPEVETGPEAATAVPDVAAPEVATAAPDVTIAGAEVATGAPGSGIQDNCSCGISRGARVVGGEAVMPHEFPWLAAFVINGYFTCGGSLITERHVLTAAHCIERTSYRKMMVTVGLHNIKEYPKERKTYSVISAKAHYLYWNGLLGIHNDIAILELNDTVKFSDVVRPICLPKGEEVYKDKPLTVAGWGHTSETVDRISNVPLKAEIKVLGNTYCRRNYWNLIFAIHICAGTEEGGKDACQGDSGGPLMSKERGRWVQAGVVSYGKGCARKFYPGLYTRVNQFLGWIERNTRTAKLCRLQRDS